MRLYACLLWALLAGCSRGARAEEGGYGVYERYWVTAAEKSDETDERWATYLLEHLNRRTGEAGIVSRERPDGKSLQVRVNVDAGMKRDYSVAYADDRLTLSARDDEKMLWLIYQFFSYAATKDGRVRAEDLPPAWVRMENGEGDFAFEYRGIYSPSNSDPEWMGITASHNVDFDWGLWGHNLRKVFPDGVPEEAYATVDGKRDAEQFCFSSEALYRAVVAYVSDNYGEGKVKGEKVRFAIMPNDNDRVCVCPACAKAGNTARSATPAVTGLLERLAARFPNHLFFTSSYLTTKEAPGRPLPRNAGVIVSAMDIPVQPQFHKRPQCKRFTKLVEQWKKATSRVYVWDYMRNFDDYLTPYPCLGILQERLRYFRTLGVKGVFYNGSGYDYASFDDVQTHALSCLLINPDCPIERLVSDYMERFYPVSGKVLAERYLSWERTVKERNAVLPYYGGIADAVSAWLTPEAFQGFCDEVDRLAKKISDEERARLNRLLTALQFTRLELLRMPHGEYNKAKAGLYLESLSGHGAFPEMKNYREANGDLDEYIRLWDGLMAENGKSASLLKGVGLRAKSKPDMGYANLSLLTDGLYGLPSDYHTGWVISSPKRVIWEIPAGTFGKGETLELSFLFVPKWRIRIPKAVELWQEGRKLSAAVVPVADADRPFVKYRVKCRLDGVRRELPLELRLTQADGKRSTIACDEIELR